MYIKISPFWGLFFLNFEIFARFFKLGVDKTALGRYNESEKMCNGGNHNEICKKEKNC